MNRSPAKSLKFFLLFVFTVLVSYPDIAQGQYYYYPPHHGYPYSGYPAAQPQYTYPEYQAPRRQAPYDKIPYPNGRIDTSKPIEIWLGKQIGRWGDYWFPALGGKPSHPTPKGKFTVTARHKDFYSRKYESKMPRSVFFTSQCAIHVGSLKTKSHGCIHVDWEAGQLIYDNSTTGKTRVVIHP